MSTRPFHNCGLAIDNARVHLDGLDFVRLTDPQRFEQDELADEYQRTLATLRAALFAMRSAADTELERLRPVAKSIPQGDPPPEKAAGYISASLDG
jgi:hypothetical protein